MPIIKSAKKRVRVSEKARVRNASVKSSLRSAMKSFTTSLTTKKNVNEAISNVHSELDKAEKKGLMHKNKVARKKRQLAAASKKAGVSIEKSSKKPVAKKSTPAKTAVAKKAPAKKPVAKKKPVTKKK